MLFSYEAQIGCVCRRERKRMKIRKSCFFYANIIWVVLDKLFILKKVCRDGLFAEEMLDLRKFSLLTMMKNCSSVNKIEQ